MMTATKILAQHPLFVPTPLWMWAEHAAAPILAAARASAITETSATTICTANLLPEVSFGVVERAVTAARAQVGENAAARQVAALCWSTNWPETGR